MYPRKGVMDSESGVVFKNNISFADHSHGPTASVQVGEFLVSAFLHKEGSMHIPDGGTLWQDNL